ncbi:MAG: hypothetical protein KDN19_04055 [Verrucomicrobiae bacterium]|nr:hypothetical protein [Verrucomicrobiae bacterium]
MSRRNHEDEEERSYLKRLHPEAYRGHSYIHWSMTIENRKRGWLGPEFHWRFRELLTHAGARYGINCPLYCLMPDHWHLLWIGYKSDSDQRPAAKFLRTQANRLLQSLGDFRLQKQPYDNVLRQKDRDRDAFAKVACYIRENPLRAGLIQEESKLPDYPYDGCVIPGYPSLSIWDDEFWERFWNIHYRLVEGDHES